MKKCLFIITIPNFLSVYADIHDIPSCVIYTGSSSILRTRLSPNQVPIQSNDVSEIVNKVRGRMTHTSEENQKRNLIYSTSTSINKLTKENNSSKVFITGGIGDIFAVDSFMTEDEIKAIDTIYYATRAADHLIELFKNNQAYKHIENHIKLVTDFSTNFCVYSANHLKKTGKFERQLENIKDLSILFVFTDIKNMARKYIGSSFIRTTNNCDISKFNLPDKYAVVHPYSANDARIKERDFNEKDWDTVLKMNDGIPIVLLGSISSYKNHVGFVPKKYYYPDDCINLIEKATISESIEILKGAESFYGVDSCFSVLSSKLILRNFKVKTCNMKYLQKHMYCYYAPFKNYDFLKEGSI